jgi:hypothetical protein
MAQQKMDYSATADNPFVFRAHSLPALKGFAARSREFPAPANRENVAMSLKERRNYGRISRKCPKKCQIPCQIPCSQGI